MATLTAERVAKMFVEITDTLVAGFDLVEFLQMVTVRSTELVGSTAAGLLLADPQGHLQFMAASDERTELLELFQVQSSEGPCLECFHSGVAVVNADLASAADRWPLFAPRAVTAGFRSVHAFPMRLRDEVIGALNLFGTEVGPMDPDLARTVQALADVATIGLLQERAVKRGEVLTEQLQGALTSRAMIEQAKGAIAHMRSCTVDEAFVILRTYCRDNKLRMSSVALSVVTDPTPIPGLTAVPAGSVITVAPDRPIASGEGVSELLAADQLVHEQLVAAQLLASEQAAAGRQLAQAVAAAAELTAAQLVWAEELAAAQLVVADSLAAAQVVAARRAAVDREAHEAMESSPIGMCLTSVDGRFTQVNPALCTMFGRPAQEFMALTWQELTHEDDLATDLELVQDILDGGRNSYRVVKRFVAADGGLLYGDLSVSAVRGEDGAVSYFVAQVVDITVSVVAERALASREELLRIVLDNSSDSIQRLDRDLRVEYVNARLVELSGIAFDDWIGKTYLELGFPTQLGEFLNARYLRVLDTGEPVTFEFEFEFDGQTSQPPGWFESSVTAEFTPEGTVGHVVVTTRDISQRKAADGELRRMATHDVLTGLANRAGLLDEIGRALRAGQRRGQSTAVLLIDLDRFKDVNDSLGHGIGDELLVAVAARLRAWARGGDLVARPGGDEFVVVMRDLVDPGEAVLAAGRLAQAFREPFSTSGAKLHSTASIGVAVTSEVCDAEDLVRDADTAMYVAKAEGRDRVSVYNEDLRQVVLTRIAIEGELRNALAGDELAVWYQPEIDLTTGSLIAVEALLRWHHPSGETYTADRFIEVAEDTGLILPIGDWVMKTACAQAAAWTKSRPDRAITLRVNLSALQLVEATLLPAIDDALQSSGMDPKQLCVEITETALLRQTQTARDNLNGISSRGIQIAIDDFGTGYASLTYLRQYPIDLIKIDRSFVTHIAANPGDHQLVAGIIAFARHLGVSVTAEGVEDEQQAAVLREMGCPGAQGWLYSKAVPANLITPLFDRTFPNP